jgi:hypothetical protein
MSTKKKIVAKMYKCKSCAIQRKQEYLEPHTYEVHWATVCNRITDLNEDISRTTVTQASNGTLWNLLYCVR